MALLRFLRDRQESINICEHTRLQWKVFKQLVRPRCIPLGSVLGDSGRELLEDHVLIGFSYYGPYLISYKPSGPFHDREFSLHWWLVDLGQPLRLVKSCNLFEGFSFGTIDTDLRITELKLCVCQKDEENVFVFGYEDKDDSEAKDFYISILSPPPSNPTELNRDQASPSVHLKYQALPPYPLFDPTLSLQLQDTILVNTGCTIVAIEKSRSPPLPSLSPSSALSAGGVGCTIVHQSFLLPRGDNASATNVYSSLTSLSQVVLPVEVYYKERALVEVSLPSSSSTDPEMRVNVSQYCFDIEPWLVSTLEDILLKTVHVNLSSLNDYEMIICRVCPEDKIVCLLVKVNAASFSEGTPLYQGYSIKLMCEWNLLKNEARLITHSHPLPISLTQLNKPLDGRSFEIDKSDLLFYSPVHGITNSSVLSTGESLLRLDHDFLPLCLVYSEPD